MSQFILRRFLSAVPTLILVTFLIYLFINLAPGDPVTALIDPMASGFDEEFLQATRERLGLNRPLPVRYLIWLKEVLRGNLGYSDFTGQSVLERIAQRFGATVRLTLAGFLLAVAIGVPVGIISSIRQYSILDYVVTVLSFLGVSIPVFFLGMLGIFIFSLRLKVLPTAGMSSLAETSTLTDALAHLVMPAMVVGLASAASYARYTRACMLEVLGLDYLRTARGKGLKERWVILKHALPNALMPIITLMGLTLPRLFSGAVITETVFAWPGMGRLLVDSVRTRDYTLLMGITLIIAILVFLGNLMADILYAYADPRVKY
jgi:peptide/nickel transport system permease protein